MAEGPTASSSVPHGPGSTAPVAGPAAGYRWTPLVVLVVGVLLGLGTAVGLNDALGIRFVDRDRPAEPTIHSDEVAAPAAFEPIDVVAVPADDDWLVRGASRLADALEDRSGLRPEVATSGAEAPSGRRLLLAEVTGDTAALATDATDESFVVETDDGGILLRAATRDGQLVGLAWLADRIAAGAGEAELTTGQVVTPDLPLRLTDLGGLGVPRDPADWDPTNYSHDVRRFESARLPGPPWIDTDAFAAIEDDFLDYLDLMRSYGNNGIVADGFLEFVDLDDVGDGQTVYPADSPYREHHGAMRAHFGRLWQLADDAGMDVYLMHTELALTPPLERYLLDAYGTIDTADPRVWAVHQAALAELFERFPTIDGVIVRIGEAGDIYDPETGLEYTTRLEVRTDAAVRAMLEAFLAVAEAYDKQLVFRSWTVGVGEVGRLHHDVEVYERVLGGLEHPNLVVSTKYVQGDFYRFIPFNATLLAGDHRRIVELQNRLEFEGFMAFPNLVGPLHGAALEQLLGDGAHLEGVWQWNQDGGPQQAGPQSLYPFHGDWQHVDANAYTSSRFALEVGTDASEVAADWVRRRFGDDPEVVVPLTGVLARSRDAAVTGLYVSAYADQLVQALGLDTTPMMWIFEWDIVSGDAAVLATTYLTARDDLDAAIAEGEEAVRLAREMRELAAGVDPGLVTDPALLAEMVASLEYQVDLFETLAAWRATFLTYHRWLDTGEVAARDAWRTALATFEPRRAAHVASYGRDLDRPAYSFDAVDRGLVHATRTSAMSWLARGLLAGLVVLAALAALPVVGVRPVPATRAIAASLAAPGTPTATAATLSPRERRLTLLLAAAWSVLAVLAFSSFASPHYLALQVMVVGVFAGVVAFVAGLGGRTDATGPTAAVVGITGPLLAVTAVLVAVLAVRGPGYFWLRFWTSAGFRTWFTTLSVALLVWLAYAVVVTLRAVTGRRTPAAFGGLLAAVGTTVAAIGAVPGVAGLERMLTGLNDELAVLPLGLSRILGITVHLDIPTALPGYLVTGGGVLVAAGALLWWLDPSRGPGVARSAAS